MIKAVYLYGEHERVDAFFSQPAWQSRIKVFVDEREPAAVWYFVHDGSRRRLRRGSSATSASATG